MKLFFFVYKHFPETKCFLRWYVNVVFTAVNLPPPPKKKIKKSKISSCRFNNCPVWLSVWFTDQHILTDLERKKILVFTPSRRFAGKRVVCNDDRFIVKLAYECDGIIVSNDMYRDLQGEEPKWKRFIEERLLMYSFVNNKWVLWVSLLKRSSGG